MEAKVKKTERALVIQKIVSREPRKIIPAGSVAKAIKEDRESA